MSGVQVPRQQVGAPQAGGGWSGLPHVCGDPGHQRHQGPQSQHVEDRQRGDGGEGGGGGGGGGGGQTSDWIIQRKLQNVKIINQSH